MQILHFRICVPALLQLFEEQKLLAADKMLKKKCNLKVPEEKLIPPALFKLHFYWIDSESILAK